MIRSRLPLLLPKNAFLRGVTLLAGGTAGAQLLAILASPIITRLYTPGDFGIVAVYSGLLAVFAAIATLHYHLAIPLPEDDHVAAHLLAVSLVLVLVVVTISIAVVALFRDPIAATFGVPQLSPYLWLLPVGVLLGGIYQVFSGWSTRTKQFSTLAETNIRQALASVAIQLAGFSLGFLALLLAQLASQGAGSARLASHAFKRRELWHLTWRRITEVAIRYRRFPAYSSWAGLLAVAGAQVAPLMFSALFGAAAAGLYALAHRILTLPLTLVGGAVGNVFLANGAELHRKGRLSDLVATVHDRLAQIAMPPALIIFAFGPELFTVVFGEAWREAGALARWMVPWLYIMLCDSGLRVFIITGHQRLALIMHAIQWFLRLMAILIGAMLNDFHISVMLFSAVSVFSYGVFIYLKFKLTHTKLSIALRSHLKAMAFGLLCLSPLLLMRQITSPSQVFITLIYALVLSLISIRYFILYRHEQ